jgi:hypothetical protein
MYFPGMMPESFFLPGPFRMLGGILMMIVLVMAHKQFNDLINIPVVATIRYFKSTWL